MLENLKIKVSDEKESKEAQELFFGLGYKNAFIPSKIGNPFLLFAKSDGFITWHDDVRFFEKKKFKEITLQQLRDLVLEQQVATHNIEQQALKSNPKLFLDPTQNYAEIEWDGTTLKGDAWIEVPEWANYAYDNDQGVCFLKDEVGFNHPLLLWQRTQDNSLPFVDDEPKYCTDPQRRCAAEINAAAMQHIIERGKTYDSEQGERSANKTAQAFNAITGKLLSESDVWLLLSLLKMVRQESKQTYHKDSAEDLIAYTSLYAESLELHSSH